MGKLPRHVEAGEAVVQQPDGAIIRTVENKGELLINIGSRKSVTLGLTFEVYDKNRGIPALGNKGSRIRILPVGKAWLEVIAVGPDTSECQVTDCSRASSWWLETISPISCWIRTPSTTSSCTASSI